LNKVREDIKAVCQRAGRSWGDVLLVGVTKYSDVAAINEAIESGLGDIAENRVQSASEKFASLSAVPSVRKHLIGHLQTNKAKEAVALFDLIQSVDSQKLVDEINKRALAIGKVQDILIQIDIAKEEQKFGLPEGDLEGMVAHCKTLGNIRVLGLMTMAPLTDDTVRVRAVFRRCKEIFDGLKGHETPSFQMKYLSMGMSGDMGIAIEEGATMVRVGSAIFKEQE
jgi:PLP dependent protein